MFKKYGYLGIILIALGEFLIFKRVEPYSTYLFFLSLWWGYILFIDALVYWRRGRSRLSSTPKPFWLLFVYSAAFWWFYELLNIFVDNWRYEGVGEPYWLMATLSFSTVLPAVFETCDLLLSFQFWDKIKWKINLNSKKIGWLIFIGIVSLVLPFVLPKYTYGLVWVSMFLLLDPLNYLLGNSSILKELNEKRPKLLFSLMFGTLICGFFWEFWNYWAPVKWYYSVPLVGFFKIFEMPILGFIGYLPFGLSLYAMYHFVLGLFSKKNKDIK